MIADIGAPDFETKVAILQQKASEQGLSLDTEVAHYIAEKVRSNVRELEGCLIKLNIYSSLHNIEIDLPVAQEVLRGIIRDPLAIHPWTTSRKSWRSTFRCASPI